MIDRELQEIQNAADGLYFISETDAPFDLVHFNTNSKSVEDYLKQVNNKKPAVIETRTLDDFFKSSTTSYPTDTQEQSGRVQRFKFLKETLEHNLSEIIVYRIGQIQIDVYILGKIKDGTYAGLHTRQVET